MAAHNNPRSKLCGYTLGAERCPGLGTRRIGGRWYCELHKHWYDNGRDQELGEEYLREQQEAMAGVEERIEAGDDPRALAQKVRGPAADALAHMHAMLDEKRGGEREPPSEMATRLMGQGLELYRDIRAERERFGMSKTGAHEEAVGLVFLLACVWGWR